MFIVIGMYNFGSTIRDNYLVQGRNSRENLDATSAMVGRICPPGGDKVKVSENLDATSFAPVAPVDTSLQTGQN